MKRAAWVTVVICVILLADLLLFREYLSPLAWHARHGNHVEMNGFRFKVPLLYVRRPNLQMNAFTLNTAQSRFRSKAGSIDINFHRLPPLLPDLDGSRAERMRKIGFRQASSRKVLLAGHEGTCLEYVPFEQGQEMGSFRGNLYSIRCRFGESINANFYGTQNAIPDFYAVLESGEDVKGKH